jgi:hypothetical protein
MPGNDNCIQKIPTQLDRLELVHKKGDFSASGCIFFLNGEYDDQPVDGLGYPIFKRNP